MIAYFQTLGGLYSFNFLNKSAEAAAPAPKAITPVVRVLESSDDMIEPCPIVSNAIGQ